VETFTLHGYAASTNKMIAASANIAPGLIYHYFDSKQDLFATVYSQITHARHRRSKDILSSELALPEKIDALARDLVETWKQDKSYVEFHARIIYERQAHPPLAESIASAQQETREMWMAIAKEAQRRGDLPSSLSPEAVADLLITWFSGLVALLATRGPERALAATDLFISGIRGVGAPQ
jgi:AcrR family transcriptional regulator